MKSLAIIFMAIILASATDNNCKKHSKEDGNFPLGKQLRPNLAFPQSDQIKVFKSMKNMDGDKLITGVPGCITQSDRYIKFVELLRKFKMAATNPNPYYYISEQSVNAFVDHVLSVPGVQAVKESLRDHRCCQTDQAFRESFKSMWFTVHDKTPKLNKNKKNTKPFTPIRISAFLSNYVGYLDEDDKVDNFHGMNNWIAYYVNQESGRYLFKGTEEYIKDGSIQFVKAFYAEKLGEKTFTKIEDTHFLIGSDPLVEMAMYLGCFFTANNCYFYHNNYTYMIDVDSVTTEEGEYPNKFVLKLVVED